MAGPWPASPRRPGPPLPAGEQGELHDPAAPFLRRLDGRFLLPPPRKGVFAHLVILGGPPGIAEAALAAGIARRAGAALPAAGSADALFVLHGARVAPEEAALCLAPGGCAWFELESRRQIPRTARLRTTGVYAVLPRFERPEAYVPLDPPGALRWYAETLLPSWTLGKRLRRTGLRLLGEALLPWRYALTAVAGPEGPGPATILDHPALPSALGELHPLLLAQGPERVVVLPFAPGATSPAAVLKVPRLPRFNARTEGEQALLAHLWGRLDREARRALPEPRGIFRDVRDGRPGGLALGLESYAAGRPMAQRVGSWGRPFRGQAGDLSDAADWLAGFHQRTEVRRAEWGPEEAAEWIEGPLADLKTAPGAAPEGLLAAVRLRTGELAGAELPIVCQHRDFTPWNLLCADRDGLRVVDWEGARPGPALCDLLHFSTHWSELALRAFDDGARLRVCHEVWLARRGGEPGEAVRRAVAAYCAALRLDRRFVPLLLVATWAELALRRGAAGREAAYLAVLAEGAGELFGGWREAGWR